MDNKTIWATVGVSEISDDAPRGQTILLLCIDLFATRFPPCHRKHSRCEEIALRQKHRGLTREKLKTVVRSLTDSTIDTLKKESKPNWDRFQVGDAEELLDIFLMDNVDFLVKIIYRKFPNKKYEAPSVLFTFEDGRLAGVMAHLFDLAPQAEAYLRKRMPTNYRIALR